MLISDNRVSATSIDSRTVRATNSQVAVESCRDTTNPLATGLMVNAGVNLLRQPEAAKPEEKSRPVVEGPCEMATTASYSLEFSGGEAIFAESRGKTVQNRLTNIELLSSF